MFYFSEQPLKYNNVNQSPIVQVNVEEEPKLSTKQTVSQTLAQPQSQIQEAAFEITKINSKKKILSKFVEITTKTIITYEDGSKKELIETENHTFK